MSNPKQKIPIKNFHQVNEWLYRGAQPSMDSFASLRYLDIKTVINVRWRKGAAAREGKHVTELGMNFKHIPLNYWTLPSQKAVDEFIALVDDEQNRPVFIHCLHGADRTGVLIAMFRILRCGWTFRQAYTEMVECGFHRISTRHFKWALWRLAKHSTRRDPSLRPFR